MFSISAINVRERKYKPQLVGRNLPMASTLRELAELLSGTLQGDGDTLISGAAIIRDACPGDITLADNARHLPQLHASRASAAIVGMNFLPEGIPCIQVPHVHAAFAKAVQFLRPAQQNIRSGIDPSANVHATAIVATSAYIGPGTVVGARAIIGEHAYIAENCNIHAGVHVMDHCRIAENCELFPNVVLYENTELGPRVLIHASCVIGAYGFGYEDRQGKHYRSAQLGNVEIEADVEIGACTTIDRGTYGPTRIGEGTKIDNQVQIAHNCRIGKHNLICSHVGIAGSASTGDNVILAGQVGVRDHVHIGDRSIICAQAGVMNEVAPGSVLVGSPAIAEREQLLVWAAGYKLPEMRKQFKVLQRIVEQMHGPHPELNASDSGIHAAGQVPLVPFPVRSESTEIKQREAS
jgi:UDP-3-O-[3-hydroxymyristoyl] glucosamine N-acyltransferase